MTIGLDRLLELRDEHGSVFVFNGRGRWFWGHNIEAYPFPKGVLLIREADDEGRWPGAFATESSAGEYILHGDLPADRAAALRELWWTHLAGIVEYASVRAKLPPWAFPPDKS